ncbi:MAG: hypothetical protein M3083_03285 [Actinomycetota bacterium]|nr:hypothetical protein [Actinomycetota bacterium]MDQ6946883.1 hypothetical protein [Actinomycetota bacterium]
MELASIEDANLIAESVRAVLPDGRRGGRRVSDLAELLRERHMLLVLDKCEHLVARCADFVGLLLTPRWHP